MEWVVKVNGDKVKGGFATEDDGRRWGERWCRGKIDVVPMKQCALPRACKPIKPNLDMPDLRYKPFVSLA